MGGIQWPKPARGVERLEDPLSGDYTIVMEGRGVVNEK